jgi:hypothetical protein
MNLEDLICRPIVWQHDPGDRYRFFTLIDGQRFELRLNDFPDEPACTLCGNGVELDLEELGEHWNMPWMRKFG